MVRKIIHSILALLETVKALDKGVLCKNHGSVDISGLSIDDLRCPKIGTRTQVAI